MRDYTINDNWDWVTHFENEILKIRIQHVDNTINMLETLHGHSAKYNFVVFLNDNFNGGELIFDNISIKPPKRSINIFYW